MSQSNTKEGEFSPISMEDLDHVSDVLLCASNWHGELGVRRPRSGDDRPIYVLIYGAQKGDRATVRPLTPWRNMRIEAKGSGLPGDELFSTSDGTGRVYAGPAPAGTPLREVRVGIAEERFTDGQLVKMRPL